MQKSLSHRRTFMCGSAVLAVLMSFQAQAQQPAFSTATQARITRIQSGLLPSVMIKGQRLPAMKLADRMQYYRVPGVSIAFFDHGQIVWAESYGVADAQTGRPVTPETLFQAGSISKPIAALGALRLVESGKLKLNENVNDELTSWKLPENEFTANQKVTLRRILSHSGGVGVHGFGGYELTQPLPSVVQILDGTKPANSPPVRVEAVPGSVWSYSGGGIMIMQLMMMEATDKSFPAQMHDLVLGPIGMSHSTYEEPLPLSLRVGAAHGYEANGDPVPGGFHIYPEMAAAGLWTTPSDLALAAIEVQNEYAGTSHKVLSQALTKEMLAHQKDTWGLGFELEKPGATPRFDHFGVNAGFVSVVEAYRDKGQGIVIMTNGQQGEKLITEILRSVAHEYAWPDFQPVQRTLIKLDPASLKNLEGTYDQADPDGQDKLTITIRDGHPYIVGSYSVGTTSHFTISEPLELLPETQRQYFTLLTGDTSFRFEKTDQGTVERCIVVSGANQREARKISH
jgi:CubicO group peptidase (beta-lactamase class C family)